MHGTTLLTLATSIAAAAGTLAAEPWRADPELVERRMEGQQEFNYRESAVPAIQLPEVVPPGSEPEAWRERRAELLELFREQVYGISPGPPETLEFDVLSEQPDALDGAATLRVVELRIGHGGEVLPLRLYLYLPNERSGPVPAALLICNREPSHIEPQTQSESDFWPVEAIIARGYATAAFWNGDVDPDEDDGFANGVHGLFEDPAERTGASWGTLAAWAWGASRCLDYLVADPDVDGSRVALLGHSRGGKAALWAAAEDERFAMVVSNQSGCGGAALSRRRFGETVARITRSFPHWFCGNFAGYADREHELPVDQHQLLALIAPRPIFVASAADDLWADPRGEFLALAHAGPAFALHGLETLPAAPMPALGELAVAGRCAFRVRPGGHDLGADDWQAFLDFADQLQGR